MNKPIIEVKDLFVEYTSGKNRVKAVNGITFSLNEGEALGLVGETGAGKTTTALSIMMLIQSPAGKVVSGEVFYRGENVLHKTASQLRSYRGKEVSMIFQDPMTALNPMHTVGKQISEVVSLHRNVSKQEAVEISKAMMETVGIERERFDDYPHQFSGGMRQRIVIAIALACNPSVLIADEPTTALDVTIQAQVLDLISTLREREGTSLILITHDLGVVAEICDTVGIVYAGEIIEYGTAEDLYQHKQHPYTIGLFGSIPNFNERVHRLSPIPGLMPDPTKLDSGCPFAPRCKHKIERCVTEETPYLEVSEGHFVRCNLHFQRRAE